MGVYYNFQAATSGTGGTMTGQNSNVPDTFCPLGWQLPYSGTGGDYYDKSKSWKYLQDNFYSEDLVMKYPLSYIGSGSYDLSRGIAYQFGGYGYYYSGTNYSSSVAFILRSASWESQVITDGLGKTSTGTLRCVDCFSIHSSTARWKEQMYTWEMWTEMSTMITHIMVMVKKAVMVRLLVLLEFLYQIMITKARKMEQFIITKPQHLDMALR